eukprot:CAMPEP_0198507260 /NCGR_PEP_ID=MMETSP1462-20131121/12203_1 /TAXON_ID=1333877 /ORGANISM="Brandtodinium nutriculum, Strain RCC3387" /LENGTH=33 /DNA_ID= /DNA_START= /DNA_END= /DNA_ORIENTATION=
MTPASFRILDKSCGAHMRTSTPPRKRKPPVHVP